MSAKSKAGYRWKKIAKFVVHVEQCSSGQMWRIVTSAGKTDPQPLNVLFQPVSCALGTGEKYEGRVLLKRIKN